MATVNLILTLELVMTQKKAVYKSFLIRICISEAHKIRRVIVTRVSEAGEQYYFANLDDLMMFLLGEMENRSKGESPMV